MDKIDPKEFRNVCGEFATGVTIVSSKSGNQNYGMTVNGFMSVSLDPPLIVVSIGKNQKLHDIIADSGIYSVSILSEYQMELSNHFAGMHNPDLVIDFEEQNGIPYLKGCNAHIVAKVVSAYQEGDHTLYVGEVNHFESKEGENPLLFFKGKYKNIKED